MAKYTREVEVSKYQKGMEDGCDIFPQDFPVFFKWMMHYGDIIQHGTPIPYIISVGRKQYLTPDDYIALEKDGTKYIIGPEDFKATFGEDKDKPASKIVDLNKHAKRKDDFGLQAILDRMKLQTETAPGNLRINHNAV